MLTVQGRFAKTPPRRLMMMSRQIGCALLAVAACAAVPGAASAATVNDTKRVTNYPLKRLQVSSTFTIATCKFRIFAGNYGTAPFAQLQHRSSGCRPSGRWGASEFLAGVAVRYNYGAGEQWIRSAPVSRSGVFLSQATFQGRPAISVGYSLLSCGYSAVQRRSICRQVYGQLR